LLFWSVGTRIPYNIIVGSVGLCSLILFFVKARQNGGDAVIFVSSAAQLAGYYTASSASAYRYGNSATAYGSYDCPDYQAQLHICRDSIPQLIKKI
jgi:hypothetical protein